MGEREGAVIPPQFVGGIHGPPRAWGIIMQLSPVVTSPYLRGGVAVWRGLWSCYSVWGGTASPNQSAGVKPCVHPE